MSVFESVLKLIKYHQPAAVTGTLTEGNNSGSVTTVTGYAGATVAVKVAAASSLGGLTFAASDDDGTTYYPVLAKLLSDTSAPALSFALSASTNYIFDVLLPGAATRLRLAGSTLTGTITYRVTPYADPPPWLAVLVANATLAATQSGTWTVQPGNTPNTTAWKVDGSAVTQPVSLASGATAIAKAEDVASADADVGVPAMMIRKATPANTSGTDGDYEMLQGSAGRLWTSAVVDTALPAGSNLIGSATAVGDVASDGVDSGNPVKFGGQARSSEITAVSNADRVNAAFDLVGKQIVLPYANPENFLSASLTAITDTTGVDLIAAQSSGIRIYVTHLLVTNSHATVGTLVEIRDGTTTVLYRGYAAPAGGGFSVTLPVPLRGTAATALRAYCITTGSNVYVNASGYKGV